MIDDRKDALLDLTPRPPAIPTPTTRPFDLTEFRTSGLLYLANRTLHPFGIAIAAHAEEDGKVSALSVVETTDPLGFVYPEQTENEARKRLLTWLARRGRVSP